MAVGGGRRLPASEQVSQECLDMRSVGLEQSDTPAGEECLPEPDGLQVGLDRATGLILRPEMPLEGADQVG